MGAVEESRKAIQDFLAPETRSITAKLQALFAEQAQLRSDLSTMDERLSKNIATVKSDLKSEISADEGRTRSEIAASEARVAAAIERPRSDMPLLIRNAVLEQLLTEKQRVIDDLQRQTH